jgi:hypothetical protein
METGLEEALKAGGFELSDEAPVSFNEGGDTVVPTTDNAPIDVFSQDADIDLTGLVSSDEGGNLVVNEAAPVVDQNKTVAEPVTSPASSFTSENQDNGMSGEEFEVAVSKYISEKLGVGINGIEDLQQIIQSQKQVDIDERVAVIADFVAKTGRSPEEWFKYQSLNPSEMDDITAVRMQMITEYPSLSSDEISLLVDSKYKLDLDIYSDDEVKLSTLQLKIEAGKARKAIDELRNSYMLPTELKKTTQEVQESPFDATWLAEMSKEVDGFSALEFELGPDAVFNFGVPQDYKKDLKEKNAKLENFFDAYVKEDGRWDYETLNAHRTLIDNIDAITKSIYRQGLSDGQRQLVSNAANVDMSGPKPNQNTGVDPVREQIMAALSGYTRR